MLSNACLCSPSRNAEPLPSTEEKVFGNSNYLPTPVLLQLNFKTLFIRTIYMFFATAKWGLVLVTQGTVRSLSANFQKVALYPTGTTHGARRLYEMACDTTSYSELGTGLWNQGEIQICIIQTHLERWREIKSFLNSREAHVASPEEPSPTISSNQSVISICVIISRVSGFYYNVSGCVTVL